MATPTALPAAFTVGQVLTSADMNLLRGATRVLQVVRGGYATQTINATSTFADTGLTATITPTSNTSTILVMVDQNGCGKLAGNSGSALYLRLLRGVSSLGNFTADAAYTGTSIDNYCGSVSFAYSDAPATTSATTYKTQFSNGVNANGVIVQASSSTSSIVLMEISA
jgi:hypothetical protein